MWLPDLPRSLPFPRAFPRLPALPDPVALLDRVSIRLAPLLRHLPAWPPAWLIARLFTQGVWPHLVGQMDAVMMQRRIAVRVSDLGLTFHFRIDAAGLLVIPAGQPEVTFSGTAIDLLRLALRSEDPDALFFNRRLLIEGDTDLGLRVKNMLDGVEIDAVIAALPVGLRHGVQQLRSRLLEQTTTL